MYHYQKLVIPLKPPLAPNLTQEFASLMYRGRYEATLAAGYSRKVPAG